MKFNLTNIKMGPSRNGASLHCTLNANGRPVCHMRDAGDGGMPMFDVIDQATYRLITSEIEKLPPVTTAEYPDLPFQIDLGIFIDMLHESQESGTPFTMLSQIN